MIDIFKTEKRSFATLAIQRTQRIQKTGSVDYFNSAKNSQQAFEKIKLSQGSCFSFKYCLGFGHFCKILLFTENWMDI